METLAPARHDSHRPILSPFDAATFGSHADASRRKRNGEREAVDVNKIVKAVARAVPTVSMRSIRCRRVKTIAGLYDGATTRELDELSIRTAASFTFEEPEYARLAARLLAGFIDKEVQGLGVYSFSQSIRLGFDVGRINERA